VYFLIHLRLNERAKKERKKFKLSFTKKITYSLYEYLLFQTEHISRVKMGALVKKSYCIYDNTCSILLKSSTSELIEYIIIADDLRQGRD